MKRVLLTLILLAAVAVGGVAYTLAGASPVAAYPNGN